MTVPSWNDLANELQSLPEDQRGDWMTSHLTSSLAEVSAQRGGRHVVLYATAFLQKPNLPGEAAMITHEDMHGLMSAVYGMGDCSQGLTLVLHTPGGVTNAAESFVAYLRSKFDDIEVIVPTLAMSAGTMIALASNRIIMGRQSQLGPIDPQMPSHGRTISARAVVDQFAQAKAEVLTDQRNAHVWAAILSTLGPSLLQEAQMALAYSEEMVRNWLAAYMFHGHPDAVGQATLTAQHFNDAATHKSHGRRIDRDEARSQQVVVEDLEKSQALQEAVLTLYHVMTLVFEQTPAAKLVWSDQGAAWMKNMAMGPSA